MTSDPLLAHFKALARGDESRTQACLDGLDAAFAHEEGQRADALHASIARMGDSALRTTFDAMADLVLTHGTLAEQPMAAGWQTLVVLVALERPAAFMALTASGTRMLQLELAARLGKPCEDVFIEPTLLATDALFDYPVSSVQRLCGLARLQAAGAVAADSVERGVNSWAPHDAPGADEVDEAGLERVEDEVALIVAIRDESDAAAELARTLRETVSPLRTAFTLACENSDPVLLHARVLDAGAPWTLATTALHHLPVRRTLEALDALEQGGLVPRRIVATLVEEEEAQAHSVRLSVLDASGALVAGLVSYDLHEPDFFVARLEHALEQQHGPQLQRTPQAYFDVEVDDPADGTLRFFVPGKGWQHAARLID